MADWTGVSALAGVALGGGFSYLVMRGQVAAEREQRKQDRLSEVVTGYWAAIDRYAAQSEELYYGLQDLENASSRSEPTEDLQRRWDTGVTQHQATYAGCRQLLGKLRIFFPELELCATELLVASGPGCKDDERNGKLHEFEAAARDALGVKIRPGTEFFVHAGK